MNGRRLVLMYVEYRCAALLMSMIVGSSRALRPDPTPSRRATILESGFGWTDAVDAVDNTMECTDMDHSNGHVASLNLRRRVCISMFASALMMVPRIVLGAPGNPDPGFSGDGLLSVLIGDFAYATIRQDDRKAVLAGYAIVSNGATQQRGRQFSWRS